MPIEDDKIAGKRSKNHERGDIYKVPASLTANLYYDLLTKEGGIIDCIKAKYRLPEGVNIIVQQDGATPHTGKDNLNKINEYCRNKQIPMEFIKQPAQSPDLNVNDLGLFHSLKSCVSKKLRTIKTIDSLKTTVQKEYELYNSSTILKIWDHLEFVYKQIRLYKGQNTYPTHRKIQQKSAKL